MDIVGHANGTTGEVNEVAMRPPGALDREALLTPADRDFFQRIGAMRFSGSVFNPGAQAPRRLAPIPPATRCGCELVGLQPGEDRHHTLEATYYRLPIDAHPYATAVDRNHMVWTNLSSDDAVARFDPNTEEYTIFKLPSLGTELRHIAVDNAGGRTSGSCTGKRVVRRASSSVRKRNSRQPRAGSALPAAAGGGQ